MDVDEETKRFKRGLVLVVLFIVSAVWAYTELKYATSGTQVQATVDGLRDEITRSGGKVRRVVYHYRDASGGLHNASDTVADDWLPGEDGKVAVEYLTDTSRVAGHRNYVALTFFFVCVAGMGIGGFLFWQHVREATRPSGRRLSASRR